MAVYFGYRYKNKGDLWKHTLKVTHCLEVNYSTIKFTPGSEETVHLLLFYTLEQVNALKLHYGQLNRLISTLTRSDRARKWWMFSLTHTHAISPSYTPMHPLLMGSTQMAFEHTDEQSWGGLRWPAVIEWEQLRRCITRTLCLLCPWFACVVAFSVAADAVKQKGKREQPSQWTWKRPGRVELPETREKYFHWTRQFQISGEGFWTTVQGDYWHFNLWIQIGPFKDKKLN